MVELENATLTKKEEKSLIVRLDMELWKAVKHYAVDNTTSVAKVLRESLMEHMDRKKKK